MKSTLTPEEEKEFRKKRRKKRIQADKKRYKDFLKTETGKAYNKYVDVFGPTSVYRSARDVLIDNQALANLYLDAIEKGVPLDMSADTDIID